MSDTSCQLPNGFKLTGMLELYFQPLLFGHICHKDTDGIGLAVSKVDGQTDGGGFTSVAFDIQLNAFGAGNGARFGL